MISAAYRGAALAWALQNKPMDKLEKGERRCR
jgi:hypothetical protein